MSLEAIKLRFYTPLHLGRGMEELDRSGTIYHSDALKSAIFAVGLANFPHWADGEAENYFNGFRISSCFPFAGEELFLPKPMLNVRFKFEGVQEDRQAKTGKKVGFLSLKIFSDFIATAEGGELPISKQCVTPDGEFICESRKNATYSFFKSEVQQRVRVPLEGDDHETTPFYVDRIYFENGCGLYFLADFQGNKQLRKEVLQTLRLLGDTGIGTDRTVGNGLFEFDESNDCVPVAVPTLGTHQKQLNLGLFLPERDEVVQINLDKSSWSLQKRGGYMGGASSDAFLSLRKKSIYFFGEGSVFSTSIPLKGKYVDLKPEWSLPIHPVWRDGQCLFLDI